jgi:stage V sporulation protein B
VTASQPEPAATTTEPHDSIARSTVFALASQVATGGFTMVITVFLVRALDPHGYGVYALALAFAAIVVLPADFGVSSSTARFIAEQRGNTAAVAAIVVKGLRLKVVLTSAMALLLVALAGPISSLYNEPDLAWPLRGVAVALFGQSLVFMFANVFVALRRMAWQFTVIVTEAISETIATVGLVVIAGGATAAAFGRAIGYTIGAVAGAIMVFALLGRRAVAQRQGGPRMRELGFYGGVLMLVDGAYALFASIDVLLVSAVLGSTATGIYSAPLKLAAALHYPGLAVSNAIAPRVAKHPDDPPDVPALTSGLRRLLIFQVGASVFILVWAEPIVRLLLGPGYGESADVLRALSPFVFFQGIGPLVSVSVNYLGMARRRVPIVLACVVLNLVLGFVLLKAIGVTGAAYSVDVSYGIYVMAHLWICARLLGFSLRPLGISFLRLAAPAAAMAGVLFAFGPAEAGLAEWIVAPALAVGAYVAGMILIGEVTRAELVAMPRALLAGVRR